MRERPAGELPAQKNAIYQGKMPRSHTMTDRPDLSRDKRPCARCGNKFQPTDKRRLLCLRCYGLAGGYDD